MREFWKAEMAPKSFSYRPCTREHYWPYKKRGKLQENRTVHDSRRIYQCRKPNLPHNQQLLHASARVHTNMKHARILPLVKNIVSQRLFVSCQFCRKEWRHLITWWYLFSYSLGTAIIHKISFQKCMVALLPPSGTFLVIFPAHGLKKKRNNNSNSKNNSNLSLSTLYFRPDRSLP